MTPLQLALSKINPEIAYDHGDNKIGKLGGQLARRKNAGILAYSYYSYAAFEECIKVKNIPKINFQVHPHPASVKKILSEELERAPQFAKIGLSKELELNVSPHRFVQLCKEPLQADYCIAASNYTKSTLIEQGVAPSRIGVAAYGVSVDKFYPCEKKSETTFRVLFSGQMIQRKGLRYLLEAWKRLALRNAELTLVGRGAIDNNLLNAYQGLFKIETNVSLKRLRTLYQSSDIMCVPSLVEGFGLIFLEALACGTPVIATSNTGAADLITDSEQGFIVGIQNVEALMERLEWCYVNRQSLFEMRVKACCLAEQYTWERFRQTFRETVAQAELSFTNLSS